MLSKTAIEFIGDLTKNNSTEWMHANKKRYEVYKKEYHTFIESVLKQMKPLDANLDVLEVKNCTFRINRDIRFSKNKDPYKTNIAMWLTTNKNRKNSPGYYIHFEKGNSFIAGGVWCPEANELKKIRKEIAFFYDDLEKIENDKNFISEFKQLTRNAESELKKAPKGYEPNHEAIQYLKLKSFTAMQIIKDDEFLKSNFSENISKKLILLKPLNDFLNRALETEE